MTTFTCTYDEFRRIVADFLKAADTASAAELDAGVHCVGLHFLGIQWTGSPLDEVHRKAGAPACMRLVTKKVIERELQLEAAWV